MFIICFYYLWFVFSVSQFLDDQVIDLSQILTWWRQSKYFKNNFGLQNIGNYILKQWKYLSAMNIQFFVFLVEAFPFSGFNENKAKPDKHNFKRGLTVTLVKVRNSWNYQKNWVEKLVKKVSLWVSKQVIYKFSLIQAKCSVLKKY